MADSHASWRARMLLAVIWALALRSNGAFVMRAPHGLSRELSRRWPALGAGKAGAGHATCTSRHRHAHVTCSGGSGDSAKLLEPPDDSVRVGRSWLHSIQPVTKKLGGKAATSKGFGSKENAAAQEPRDRNPRRAERLWRLRAAAGARMRAHREGLSECLEDRGAAIAPALSVQLAQLTPTTLRETLDPNVPPMHPAEKLSSADVGMSKTQTVQRRRQRQDNELRQTQQTLWFRAKAEEMAILRDNAYPWKPGQAVYCASDTGHLMRGTLLSVEQSANRLTVARVRLHAPMPTSGAATSASCGATPGTPTGETRSDGSGGVSFRGEGNGGAGSVAEASERGPELSEGCIETFLLPAIFPIGGCNGGLESGLEKLVHFNTQEDLCGAVGLQGTYSLSRSSAGAQSVPPRMPGVPDYDAVGGSPLGLLTAGRAPAVDEVLLYLEEQKLQLMHRPFCEHKLAFASGRLNAARQQLKDALIDSETRLLRFCEVLAYTLYTPGTHTLQTLREGVEGGAGAGGAASPFFRSTGVECEVRLKGGEREGFKVEEPLSDETLVSLMSGEGFGKTSICDHLVSSIRVLPFNSFRHAHNERKRRQEAAAARRNTSASIDYLSTLAGHEELEVPHHMEGWSEAHEVTHYLVYEAASAAQVDSSGGVLQFRGSRKSAAELLDIVADKLCHVDAYVGSSSSRGYSDCRQIHNTLSVRIVVESAEQAAGLLQRLRSLTFSGEALREADVPLICEHDGVGRGECTDRLQILEVQDRLKGQAQAGAPGTSTLTLRQEEAEVGWRGLVAMVKWWGAPIMLVMEPLEVGDLDWFLMCVLRWRLPHDGTARALTRLRAHAGVSLAAGGVDVDELRAVQGAAAAGAQRRAAPVAGVRADAAADALGAGSRRPRGRPRGARRRRRRWRCGGPRLRGDSGARALGGVGTKRAGVAARGQEDRLRVVI